MTLLPLLLIFSILFLAKSNCKLQNSTPSGAQTSTDGGHASELGHGPDSLGRYHVADGATIPRVTYVVEPEYPELMLKKKLSATCTVDITVDPDGIPRDVHFVRSTPPMNDKHLQKVLTQLQQSCIKTVSQYRFSPGTFQGKPVPVYLQIEIDYQGF